MKFIATRLLSIFLLASIFGASAYTASDCPMVSKDEWKAFKDGADTNSSALPSTWINSAGGKLFSMVSGKEKFPKLSWSKLAETIPGTPRFETRKDGTYIICTYDVKGLLGSSYSYILEAKQ